MASLACVSCITLESIVSAVTTTQAPQIGPYTIDIRLGTGGQSSVYLARACLQDDRSSAWVVLKTPKVSGQNSAAALYKEARALAFVDHPNVVRMLDHSLDDNPPYLVLEHVAGVDLHRLLRLSAPNSKGVPEDLACFLCHGIALALSALHEPPSHDVPRIYHGDVSPSNILLSEHGDVKLSDFGLARTEGGAPTSAPRPTYPPVSRAAWGHRGYLAPERLEGAPPSPAADVFGLAAVLGELLIGGPVFCGEGELARLVSMKEGNLAPLLARSETIAPELVDLCRRCLDANPSRRPSAFEMAMVLEERIRKDAMNEQKLARSLSAWVSWAKQQAKSSSRTEEQVRQSLRVIQAAQTISGTMRASTDDGRALLRTAGSQSTQSISYSELVALAAAGKLDGHDQVSLFGGTFEPVSHIPALARHVIPSSTALTSEVSPLGPADYCVQLSETPLITLIGRLLSKRARGLLLVERSGPRHESRKDIYVHEGRVTHVSSTESSDRLGESLVQADVLSRQELSTALRHMVRTQGQLGESLVALKLVDPVVVYQALCSQGRDRIVSLCTWTSGTARFFSGVSRPDVSFPLDVDLHLCLVQAVDAAQLAVPDGQRRIVPLDGCPPPRTAPSSLPLLNLVPSIARKRVTVGTAVEELSMLSARGVTTSPVTYLLAAQLLGWVDFV